MATQVKKTAAGARRKPTQKASGGRSARSRASADAHGNGNGRAPAAPATKAKEAKEAVKEAVMPSSPVSTLARKAAVKTAKFVGRRALRASARVMHDALEQSSEASRRALDASLSRRLPIQVSIDVAVPLRVAWDKWMELESICEGVDIIEDIERDGDMLYGRVAGARARDWAAEIRDERELESFAWGSVEGSDCAGLVTFHELGERLTRIEVDLDVLPTSPWQAVTFASHLAHRRAEAELRRFKARLEFINPDVYADALEEQKAQDEQAGTDDRVDGDEADDDERADDDGQEPVEDDA